MSNSTDLNDDNDDIGQEGSADFRSGTEQVKCADPVTTLARQF